MTIEVGQTYLNKRWRMPMSIFHICEEMVYFLYEDVYSVNSIIYEYKVGKILLKDLETYWEIFVQY